MHRKLLPILLMLAVVAVPTAASASSATGEEVDGGAAATQATAVEPGTTYVDDINAGEARWYSVDAGTTQVVGATMTEYGEVEYGCCLNVNLHDPDFDSLGSSTSLSGGDTAQTVRVETDEDGVEEAGTYYVEVVLDEDQANQPVTFEFAVDVSGEAVQTPTPSDEASASDQASAEDGDAAGGDDTAAAAQGSDDGGSTLLWVVVGLLVVLVVLLLAALAFVFTRMNKQQPRA